MADAFNESDLDVQREGSTGPLIVLVHGIQGSRSAWACVSDALSADHRVVMPNLRGRCAAWRGQGTGDYSLEGFADDLAEVIRAHVGTRPYALAGWSLGASIALEYVLRSEAARPMALILVSGTAWMGGTHWFRGTGDELLASIADRRQRLGLREFADDQAVAWTWQAVCHSDQRQHLGRVGVPTLVLHGRDDDDCPIEHGVGLADGIGARLVALEAVGHGVLVQATDTVVDQMRGFVHQHLSPEASSCDPTT